MVKIAGAGGAVFCSCIRINGFSNWFCFTSLPGNAKLSFPRHGSKWKKYFMPQTSCTLLVCRHPCFQSSLCYWINLYHFTYCVSYYECIHYNLHSSPSVHIGIMIFLPDWLSAWVPPLLASDAAAVIRSSLSVFFLVWNFLTVYVSCQGLLTAKPLATFPVSPSHFTMVSFAKKPWLHLKLLKTHSCVF